ncbi:MAG TPA: hypothetical protein VKO83_04130, partial [Steroidobacteraceae bacterium]|nr:hypothetical protein [Steroidobacteraceae bacterium]
MRLTSGLTRALVDFSCRRAGAVVMAAAALAVLLGLYAVSHFQINTDLDSVLDATLPWRQQAASLEKAFPNLGDDITVVIDGVTPELTEQAARGLEKALRDRSGLFGSVARANGGAFFDKEGLLYGSVQEVRESTQDLIAAQPLLAQVASDPSLRGLLHSLELGMEGLDSSPRNAHALGRAMAGIGDVLLHAQDPHPKYL